MENQDTDPLRKSPTENYLSIDWNPLRGEQLADLYQNSNLDLQCQSGSGDKIVGKSTDMPIPPVSQPLQTNSRPDCPTFESLLVDKRVLCDKNLIINCVFIHMYVFMSATSSSRISPLQPTIQEDWIHSGLCGSFESQDDRDVQRGY